MDGVSGRREGGYYRIPIEPAKPTLRSCCTNELSRRPFSTNQCAQWLGFFLWKRLPAGASILCLVRHKWRLPRSHLSRRRQCILASPSKGFWLLALSISTGLRLRHGAGRWTSFWWSFHCSAMQGAAVTAPTGGRRRAVRKSCRCRQFGRCR